MQSIAVIGAGCSGTLVVQQLVRRLDPGRRVKILWFGDDERFGPGLPYGARTNDEAFLLNMKSTLLGVEKDGPLSFDPWLLRCGDAPAHQGPGAPSERYVPRLKMGDYLAEVAAELQAACRRSGHELLTISASVSRVRRQGQGFRVEATVSGRPQQWMADKIVLALGHPRKATPFDAPGRYFANPYHDLAALKAAVQPGDRIGILGTKLTGVDMALLMDRLGAGHIAMYSNSGRLPLVRGFIPEEDDAPGLDRPPHLRSLRDFLAWFRRARAWEHDYAGLFSEGDPIKRLELELAAAQGARPWQMLLDSTKHWIDAFWSDLHDTQKRKFLRKYQGMWMSYRHPMPRENAVRLLALLKSGRLTVHRGYKSTTPNKTTGVEGFRIHLSQGELEVDRVIDATGHAGNLARLDCPLLESLIDEGFVRQHPAGGLSIQPHTMELTGQRDLYALGPLTQGPLFYVSAIERLASHADTIAVQLLAEPESPPIHRAGLPALA
jgi:uncharacterized NAD(P)/FAD-binding protein YdhS